MKKRLGRERVNNCWLFVATLVLWGKLRGIVLFWDDIIPHAAGITKHGNVVHFRRTKGKPRTCSIWLTGVAEVVPIAYIKQSKVKTTKWEC
jgi:hypothetical protein